MKKPNAKFCMCLFLLLSHLGLFVCRYGDEDNTWEPVENLDCPELINEFEEKRKKRESEKKEETPSKETKKRKSVAVEKEEPKKKAKKSVEEDGRPRGFDRGLDPEKIIGATDSSGEVSHLFFLFFIPIWVPLS